MMQLRRRSLSNIMILCFIWSLCNLLMKIAATNTEQKTEHVINVLYCKSLGRHLTEFMKYLEQSFPELKGKITVEPYPLPQIPLFLNNLLTLIQLLGLSWVIFGEKLWCYIGYKNRPLPNFVYTVQNNPFPIMIFIYLLAPSIIGKFVNSGAFEIYLDDQILFSKLQSGDFPDKDYLLKSLENAGLKHAADLKN